MAKSDVITREAIILRQTPYKESDAMVTALTPEGMLSFYARGANKFGGKSAASCQALAYATYTLTESSTGSLTFKESSAPELLMKEGSLSAVAVEAFLCELTLKVVQEDESSACYPFLKNCLLAIENGAEPLSAGLIYFAHVLSFGGIGLNVDGCVNCGSKHNIVALSYAEGGFVCADCFDPETMDKTSVQILKMLRYFFKAPATDFGRVNFEPEDCLPIYARLFDYLEELTGVHLSSKELLMKI